MVDIYQREKAYLETTDPDGKFAIGLRVPFGSFRIPVKDGDGVSSMIESDHTLVSIASIAVDIN